MTNRLVALFAAAMLWSIAAYSHHSLPAQFLLDKTITVEGTVTELRLVNPHARIYFNVTTATGEVQSWRADGGGGSILKRSGWSADILKKGTPIKIIGYPARAGGNRIAWISVTLKDGTVLRGGSPVAEEYRKKLDDLDKRRRKPE